MDSSEGGIAPAADTARDLAETFVARLPLVALALVLAVLGIVLALLAARLVERALRRVSADAVAPRLLVRVLRVLLVIGVVLIALAIAGVEVGPALAGLGLAGVAVAFAVQGILENFISGIILLARKPFRAGDQIRTNDFEGTVEDLDLRVTRLIDYDGEVVIIPNVEVFKQPLVNLTRRGARRTVVVVGIDYRDDHDAAREVIRKAVTETEGVLGAPAPEVLLTELGESSVNFEVRYWTLPDIQTVRHTQDRVLAGIKRAVQDAGLTIPWPIRTLVIDRRGSGGRP